MGISKHRKKHKEKLNLFKTNLHKLRKDNEEKNINEFNNLILTNKT